MKKILIITTTFMLGFGLINAIEIAPKKITPKEDILKIVSIDFIHIMQNSKEGLKITKEIQEKIDLFQTFVKKAQEEFNKNKDSLSEEVLQEKINEIDAEIATNQNSIQIEIQKKQAELLNKQMLLIQNLCKENNWGMLIDKNAPGVLYVANAIDATEDVLKLIDTVYEESKS